MNEIIMQVARALACRPRLRILSMLVTEDEASPTALARRSRMLLPVVSAHLRRLVAVGLIQRRRSGTWSYAVARSPYGTQAFSGRVAAWLFSVLKNPTQHLPPEASEDPSPSQDGNVEARLHDLIFNAATAFANVRRLLILEHLADEDAHDGDELAAKLKMSRPALSRHTAKLVRRGYVATKRAGHRLRLSLVEHGKTRIHGEFLGLVQAEWKKTRLRS
jgi:DNA-binding MarR family transcriptional regulator